MRAVVDTNILVSGLLHPGSLPAGVLRGIADRVLTPVVCVEVMAEYAAVLPRPRLRLRPGDIGDLLAMVEATADWVHAPLYTGQPPLPDAADWPFIACALVAGCPLITGNVRHFPPHLGLTVMTARTWIDFVEGG